MVLTQSFQKLKVGVKAPDFSLKGVDDKTHSLSDFGDKEGLLVIFMCNHCPYVKAKIDVMVKLHEKYEDKVAFVGINSNDPGYEGEGMENMKIFAKERNMQFVYLLDGTQKVAKAYGATCTPDPFLFEASTGSASTLSEVERVDKDFNLVFHGRIDDGLEPGQEVKENTMDENIQKLVLGQKIPDELKPSTGCSIKWISSE